MRSALIVTAIILVVVAVTVATPALAASYGLDAVQGSGLSSATNINTSINAVITWALGFAGAIAVAFIVYGGFRYTTSAGNSEARGKAKDIILYAVIGLIVIIIAFVIVSTVVSIGT